MLLLTGPVIPPQHIAFWFCQKEDWLYSKGHSSLHPLCNRAIFYHWIQFAYCNVTQLVACANLLLFHVLRKFDKLYSLHYVQILYYVLI